MSETDHVLGLVDDLVRLLADSTASTIEVEADGFAVTVTRRGGAVTRGEGAPEHVVSADASVAGPRTQKVHAANVGIFSGPHPWNPGDKVTRGEVLGGVETLGHTSEVRSPVDGEIKEVLITVGAPVEYGQALFVISVA